MAKSKDEAARSLAAPGSAICFDYMVQAPDIASRYKVRDVLDAYLSRTDGTPAGRNVALFELVRAEIATGASHRPCASSRRRGAGARA